MLPAAKGQCRKEVRYVQQWFLGEQRSYVTERSVRQTVIFYRSWDRFRRVRSFSYESGEQRCDKCNVAVQQWDSNSGFGPIDDNWAVIWTIPRSVGCQTVIFWLVMGSILELGSFFCLKIEGHGRWLLSTVFTNQKLWTDHGSQLRTRGLSRVRTLYPWT